jgi:hypothetical protein
MSTALSVAFLNISDDIYQLLFIRMGGLGLMWGLVVSTLISAMSEASENIKYTCLT